VYLASVDHAAFGDNKKAVFGDGSDLEIFSDGTNGRISLNSASGNLRMLADEFQLANTGYTNFYLTTTAADAVLLYHGGDQKLETTSTGIDVTGTVTADGLAVDGSGSFVASANDSFLSIAHTGTEARLSATYTSTGSWTPIVLRTQNESRLNIATNGDISFYEDTGTTAKLLWDASSESLTVTGGIISNGQVPALTASSTFSDYIVGYNKGRFAVVGDAIGTAGEIVLSQYSSNGSVGRDAVTIDSSGNLLVGKTSTAFGTAGIEARSGGTLWATASETNAASFNRLSSDGAIAYFNKDGTPVGSIGTSGGRLYIGSDDTSIFFDSGTSPSLRPHGPADPDGVIDIGESGYRFKDLYLSGNVNLGTKITAAGVTTTVNAWKSTSNSTSSSKHMIFANPNGNVGDIRTNASSTAYITSSDYRLKENVVAMTGATERLKQLKPSRFNFIADPDTTVDGFLAHEVQEIVPEAIAGEKDAMIDEEYEVTPAVLDDDGNVVTAAIMGTRSVPDYQGIDQSKLVPLLVATIQELEARIAQLEGAN